MMKAFSPKDTKSKYIRFINYTLNINMTSLYS